MFIQCYQNNGGNGVCTGVSEPYCVTPPCRVLCDTSRLDEARECIINQVAPVCSVNCSADTGNPMQGCPSGCAVQCEEPLCVTRSNGACQIQCEQLSQCGYITRRSDACSDGGPPEAWTCETNACPIERNFETSSASTTAFLNKLFVFLMLVTLCVV